MEKLGLKLTCYGGYVPQFTFSFGDTYGRTTHELLTDPSVRKSPRSLLAPLDYRENLLQYHYHIDHPGYVTYQPITSPPEIPLGPQPVPTVLEEPVQTPVDAQAGQCPPAVPGAQQGWQLPGLAPHPAAEQLQRELALAPLARFLGKGTGPCQCQCAGSPTLETGGVALPGGVATADYTLPVLPVPNAIRQKATLGYTGYIPCSLDNVGMTYLLSVKKAMQEFDRRQMCHGSLLTACSRHSKTALEEPQPGLHPSTKARWPRGGLGSVTHIPVPHPKHSSRDTFRASVAAEL